MPIIEHKITLVKYFPLGIEAPHLKRQGIFPKRYGVYFDALAIAGSNIDR